MNSIDAKRILLAHRPDGASANDPDIAAALAQVQRDPALAQWWREQQAFHAAMKKGFGEIPVPEGLREQIRRRTKIVPFPRWRNPRTWSAAAAAVLLFGLAALFWQRGHREESFETFRSRMVRGVLRQYRMDIRTNDMPSIRQFLAAKNAPADYTVPAKLAQFPTTGGGVMSWQATRASMVCFDSGGSGTAFLFVVNRSDVKQPPPVQSPAPKMEKVSELMTASWAEGEKVYVLAFEDSPSALKKFF